MQRTILQDETSDTGREHLADITNDKELHHKSNMGLSQKM